MSDWVSIARDALSYTSIWVNLIFLMSAEYYHPKPYLNKAQRHKLFFLAFFFSSGIFFFSFFF